MLLITAKEIIIYSYLVKVSIFLTLSILGVIAAAVVVLVHYWNKADLATSEEADEYWAICRKKVIKYTIILGIMALIAIAKPSDEGYRRSLINKYQQETQVNYDEAEFRVNQILGRTS